MTANWGECYIDHYPKFLGEAIGSSVFRDDPNPSIQILSFDGSESECGIFCSLGLTHYADVIGGAAEVCCVTSSGWDSVPAILAGILFFMIDNKIELDWGMSINGIKKIDPDFAETYQKSAVYLTLPQSFPDNFYKVPCGDRVGRMYQAMFITEAEHRFFLEHGADSFETLLEESQVDPVEINRASCV